jgi:ACS family hexuronate transporter-like MFS transporter
VLRWWVAGLIFLATLINFVNRLTVAVLGPVITNQLGLSASEFASLTTVFLVAYTISQGLSGRLYDRIGAKRGFAVSIVVWSVASMAHAFATGLASLNCFRFLLGLGEAGNWPGAAKEIAEWIPPRQRALGRGIFNSGTSIVSVVAPPLIIAMETAFGWRPTFLVVGAAGFVWLGLWLWFYESPERHRWISKAELEELQNAEVRRQDYGRGKTGGVLHRRETWGIVLGRFCCDPVWWLYVTWLPMYLYKVHGFSVQQIGAFAWLPFVAADAGALSGGWLSGYLIQRGWSVDRARKSVIVLGMLCMCTGVFAAKASGAGAALAWIAVVLYGFQTWINNVQTMPSDYFPQSAVGAVTGMGGVGAGIGSMLLIQTTGLVVDRFGSYTPVLIGAAVLPLVGTGLLFWLGGRIRRLELI